jgi:uncharacterized membrane protein YbhN (UPF0104 family)
MNGGVIGRPASPAAARWRSTLAHLARLLIAGGLLYWLGRSGRLDFGVLLSFTWSLWAAAALAALLGNMLLQAIRWWLLLRIQNIRVPLRAAIGLSWIGQFFSLLLPGATGGELVRGYYIFQDAPGARLASVSTLLFDRGLGVFGLVSFAVPAVVILRGQVSRPPQYAALAALIAALAVGCALAVALVWWPPARRLSLALTPARHRPALQFILATYEANGRLMAACAAVSLASMGLLILAFYLTGRSLDHTLSWVGLAVVVPLVAVANSLPIAPGGIGLGETAATVLFVQFGTPIGAEIMLLVRVAVLLLRLPGGVFYLLRRAAPPAPRQPVGIGRQELGP